MVSVCIRINNLRMSKVILLGWLFWSEDHTVIVACSWCILRKIDRDNNPISNVLVKPSGLSFGYLSIQVQARDRSDFHPSICIYIKALIRPKLRCELRNWDLKDIVQHILRINWDELNRLHVKIIGDGALLHSPEVYFKELFLPNLPIGSDI